jgi:hypothetical protein
MFLSASLLLAISLSDLGHAQKPTPNNCEQHSASLDLVREEALRGSAKDGVVIAIARLGTGESSRELSRRRLENVRAYLRGQGISGNRLVAAEGEKVNGYGRVEMYVAGKLMETLYASRNKDLCVDCCDINERYYPYRKDKGRKRG